MLRTGGFGGRVNWRLLWGWELRSGRQVTDGMESLLGMVKMFWNYIVMIVVQLCEYNINKYSELNVMVNYVSKQFLKIF